MATGMELATEAEKLAQEALKKKKAEEAALLAAYSTGAGGLYDTAKSTSTDYLTQAKSDIQGLYNQGYSQLEDISGQQSAAAMKELVRQQENKLSGQGLLSGPSGALNEALASAAERVRISELDRLGDYISNRDSALANVYNATGKDLSALEQAYAGQKQGILSSVLGANLSTAEQAAKLSDQYAMAGLEGALGTNKISVETAAQQDLAKQQADLQAALTAAQEETARRDLANRQQAWDYQYQSVYAQLYSSYRQAGWPDAIATQNAKTAAMNQMGPRPVQ